MNNLNTLVDKLVVASRRQYRQPEEGVAWLDSFPEDAWAFSPEWLSLYGTPAYDALDERGRQRLSFYETVNFFSLNVHGEKRLVESLVSFLYRDTLKPYTAYLHHFVDEENKHMMYFGGFCGRYAKGLYPERSFKVSRAYQPGEEEFLVFAQILIFEEIVDQYNTAMARDGRLPKLVRDINDLHHREEARHLAFGRAVVAELYQRYVGQWGEDCVEGIRAQLQGFLLQTWKNFYNPSMYRDAGLAEPWAVAAASWEHPAAKARRAGITQGALATLGGLGLLAAAAEV